MINHEGILFDKAKEIFHKICSDRKVAIPATQSPYFDKIQEEAYAQAQSEHDGLVDQHKSKAVEILKAELTNDPLGLGYTGKSDEEVANILNSLRYTTKTVQEVEPSRLESVIRSVFAKLVTRPKDLSITIEGKCLGGTPELQAMVDEAIAQEKSEDPAGVGYANSDKPMDLMTTARFVNKVIQEENHSRMLDIFDGVPYVLNTLTAEDIKYARSN